MEAFFDKLLGGAEDTPFSCETGGGSMDGLRITFKWDWIILKEGFHCVE